MKKLILLLMFFFLIGGVMLYRANDQSQLENVARLPAEVENKQARAGSHAAPTVKSNEVSSAEFDRTLRALSEASRAPWSVRKMGAGLRMSDGILPTSSADPLEASQDVLRRLQNLLGVAPESAALKAVNREDSSTQVVYQQLVDGEPVFGSRINMHFNERGELVYLVSDVAPPPAKTEDTLGVTGAATRVRTRLFSYLADQGYSAVADAYPVSAFVESAERGYWLVAGEAGRVYRFQFSLLPPQVGDMEAVVDVRDGAVVVFRNLSRK